MDEDRLAALLIAAAPILALALAWRLRSPAPARWLMVATGAALAARIGYELFVLGYVATEPQLAIPLAVILAWIGALAWRPPPWLVWTLFAPFTLLAGGVAWLLAFFRMTRLF